MKKQTGKLKLVIVIGAVLSIALAKVYNDSTRLA